MPDAETIIEHLKLVAGQPRGLSPIIRLALLALVALCIYRRRIYSTYIAIFVGGALLSAAMLAIAFRRNPNLVTFGVLFIVSLAWGREAMTLPPRPRFSRAGVAAAAVFGLFALFYWHFTDGVAGAILFAPLGLVPCPTLIAANAAIMATRRSFSIYAVVPTWVAGLFYGLVGTLYLGVALDWVLVAAVAASAAFYFASPAEEKRPRGRKFKRRHDGKRRR